MNDSHAKKTREKEEIKDPGKNTKIPKTIPLNKNIEYKLLKIIPIPKPLRNTDRKLHAIPRNVKEIIKRTKTTEMLHKDIFHNICKLLKFIESQEKTSKLILFEDNKHPAATPQ